MEGEKLLCSSEESVLLVGEYFLLHLIEKTLQYFTENRPGCRTERQKFLAIDSEVTKGVSGWGSESFLQKSIRFQDIFSRSQNGLNAEQCTCLVQADMTDQLAHLATRGW